MMPVAVTGVGLITPLGATRETSWRALRAGVIGLRRLPEGVFEGSSRFAGGLPPSRTQSAADRFVLYAIDAAREAAEDADIGGAFSSASVAVVIGSSKGGIVTLAQYAARPVSAPDTLFLDGAPCAASARVAEYLQLGGPVLAESASCATGIACLSRAADLIRDGRCEAALAGSSDASLTPLILSCFQNLGALSRADRPASACKAFDRERSGFLIGEGAAVFALESLEHARRRPATVYGVLAGLALGCEAYHETRPDPSGAGLVRCVGSALRRSKLKPECVEYVNAHGTGTPLGDAAEARAIASALGRRVLVSSTKPQTGHLLGASSAVEIAFALLAMRDEWAPGTLNLAVQDPACPLNLVPPEGRSVPLGCVASLSAGFGGQVGVALLTRAEEMS